MKRRIPDGAVVKFTETGKEHIEAESKPHDNIDVQTWRGRVSSAFGGRDNGWLYNCRNLTDNRVFWCLLRDDEIEPA